MSNIFTRTRVQSEPGAKIFFYATGTSTPQNTYQDIDLTTPHANPVVADADGYFDTIYLDPTLPDYRYTLTDSDGNTLEGPIDDVPSAANQSQSYRVEGPAPSIIFKETDASTDNKIWRVLVQSEVLKIQVGDDAESAYTDILSVGRTGFIIVSSSFTATLTGFGSALTGTINYQRVGDEVTMWANSNIAAVSTTTSMTMTGIPADIQPASLSSVLMPSITDSSGQRLCYGTITGGTMTFLPWDTTTDEATTNFTIGGNKGIAAGWIAKYKVA